MHIMMAYLHRCEPVMYIVIACTHVWGSWMTGWWFVYLFPFDLLTGCTAEYYRIWLYMFLD